MAPTVWTRVPSRDKSMILEIRVWSSLATVNQSSHVHLAADAPKDLSFAVGPASRFVAVRLAAVHRRPPEAVRTSQSEGIGGPTSVPRQEQQVRPLRRGVQGERDDGAVELDGRRRAAR